MPQIATNRLRPSRCQRLSRLGCEELCSLLVGGEECIVHMCCESTWLLPLHLAHAVKHMLTIHRMCLCVCVCARMCVATSIAAPCNCSNNHLMCCLVSGVFCKCYSISLAELVWHKLNQYNYAVWVNFDTDWTTIGVQFVPTLIQTEQL